MRRLTLILSDLYLPEEAAGDIAIDAAIELPAFEWLLRFATAERIDDWRHWLAAELGRSDLAAPISISIATSIAHAMNIDAQRGAWLATPVRLEARLDHVRMLGLARLSAGEFDGWREEFARHFGPELALHAVNERTLLLTGIEAVANTIDPARLIGTDVARSLPQGTGAPAIRRLGAEIEMWLHASALNLARERARSARVAALWLWGGAPSGIATPTATTAAASAVFGGDPFLQALSSAVTPAPTGFGGLRSQLPHVIVELAPVSGATPALPILEEAWFAPLRAALTSGALESLDIVANDRRFRIASNPGWRFWRRRRGWLESLGRAPATA